MSWTNWLRGRRKQRSRVSARPSYRARLGRPRRLAAAEGLERRELLTITVEFNTTLGNFQAELYDQQAPITVSNFLNYVTSNRLDGSFIHRSLSNFVIQGGGFTFNSTTGQAVNVPTDAQIQNEFGISNTRGTLSMAKLPGNPNSATSQFFVNLADNNSADPNSLDNQNGGFTVFGRVLGNGMEVVDAIAAVQRFNLGGNFMDLPLRNFTAGNQVTAANLLFINDIAIQGVNAPILLPIADRPANTAVPVTFTAVGKDYNTPATTLTYSLEPGAPTGATINAQTGAFNWQPTVADVGMQFDITVKVANGLSSGGQPLVDTDTFRVTVSAGQTTATPSGVDLLPETDSGRLSDDNLTNRDNSTVAKNLKFTVSGTVPGATVTLFLNGQPFIAAPAAATGSTTTITTTGDADVFDGTYQVTAKQKRPDEFISTDSPGFSLTIDTVQPTIAGQLDLAYGDRGVTSALANADQAAQAAVAMADGKVLVVGATGLAGGRDFLVSRFAANGQLDTTLGTTGVIFSDFGGTDDVAMAAAVQSDGRIIVAGMSGNNLLVARYLENGGTDNSFRGSGALNGGIGTVNRPAAIHVLPDGKILVALTVDGNFALLRLLANGDLDDSFDTDAVVTTDLGGDEAVTGMLVFPDGRIHLAGRSGNSLALVQYNADGSPDNSFDGDGRLIAAQAQAVTRVDVARLAGGELVVLAAGATGGDVLRRLANGAPDNTFDGDGRVPLGGLPVLFGESPYLRLAGDGSILVAGTSNSDFRLARLTPAGALDASFFSQGQTGIDIGFPTNDNDQVRALAVGANDAIYLVGNTGGNSSGVDVAVAKFLGGPAPSLTLAAASDTGVSASDRITRDDTPTFEVTHGDARYRILRGSTTVGDPFALTPTLTADAQPEGAQTYTVALVDDAGNLSTQSLALTVTFDYAAPRVTGVGVASSTGTQAMFEIPVGSGEQLVTVPVAAADRLRIRFSEQVAVETPDLTLTGTRQAGYSVSGVTGTAGSGGSWLTVWSLAAAPVADQLTLGLNADGASPITDLAGNLLDGEWDNPSSRLDNASDTYPSGNGAAGGNFVFNFTILAGDANRDLRVDTADQAIWQANQGAANPTFVMGDFNGDGFVDQLDENLRAQNNGLNLDEATPGQVTGTLWNDVDRDGTREAGEAGLAGFNVFLDLNGNGTREPGEPEVLTNGQGEFTFSDLSPVSYNLRIVPLAGWNPTTGSGTIQMVTVNPGQTATLSLGFLLPSAAPTTPDLLPGSDSGISSTDNLTNHNGLSAARALAFLVGGTSAGAQVQILLDGVVVGEATAAGSETTVTVVVPAPLADGIRSVTARQAASGQSFSDPSATLAVTIDTLAPNPATGGGLFDPSFGVDGRVTTSLSTIADFAEGTAIQADGKIVVIGTTATSAGASSFVVRRFLADGMPDASFGTGGVVTTAFDLPVATAGDVAIAPDGKIVVVGKIASDLVNFMALARYNPDGTLDTSFDGDGRRSFGLENRASGAKAVRVLADRRIVVVGDLVREGQSDVGVARLLEDGALDNSFSGDGQVTLSTTANEVAIDMALEASGSVLLLATRAELAAGQPNSLNVFRFSTAGEQDLTFGTAGVVSRPLGTAGSGLALVLDGEGRILAGGVAGNTGSGSFTLSRYLATGAPDVSFGTGGTISTVFDSGQSAITALVSLPDGRIAAAGGVETPSGSQVVVARYLADGRLDPSFGTAGSRIFNVGTAGDTAVGLARDAAGRLVVAATINSVPQGSPDIGLARLVDPLDAGPVLTAASDSGVSTSDRLTNVASPVFDVNPAGPFFRVFRSGAQISGDFETGTSYTANSQLEGAFSYQLRSVDAAGNQGPVSAGTEVTFDFTAPNVDVGDVSPDPRSVPVGSLTLAFNEVVLGLAPGMLSFARDGGPNLLTAGQTLASNDGRNFVLGNLTLLTARAGTYTLTAAANPAVSDRAGNAWAAPASEVFTVNDLASEDLGQVGFRTLTNQGPSAANGYWALTTLRAGVLTLESEFSPANGTAPLELFNAQLESLAMSLESVPGLQRIDRGVAAGEVYFVRRLGTNPAATLRLANVLAINGNQFQLFGTPDADTFEFTAAATHVLKLNGLAYEIGAIANPQIALNGDAGSDTLTATGGDGAEQATLGPASGQFQGGTFRLDWASVESATLDGAGGLDQATLDDSAGSDQLFAQPGDVQLTSTGLLSRVRRFERVTTNSTAGADVAVLLDSAGDDQLTIGPRRAQLAGTTYLHRLNGFPQVAVDAQQGNDWAQLYDGSGDDELILDSDQVTFNSAAGTFTVEGFRTIQARATTGYDRVIIDGTGGADTLVARPGFLQVASGNTVRVARGFDEMRSTGAAGTDLAVLQRGAAGDTISAAGGGVTMAGPGYFVRVTDYEQLITPLPPGTPGALEAAAPASPGAPAAQTASAEPSAELERLANLIAWLRERRDQDSQPAQARAADALFGMLGTGGDL